MRSVFIDGYNVISSWPELRAVKDYSLEAARQKLIDLLENYAAFKGYKIFIVFDAHMVVGSLQKKDKISDNLVVVYTKEGETADSYIEKAIDNIGRRKEVFIVTSDSLEQQLAFQRGAIRVSSIEFYFEVKDAEERIKRRIEKQHSEKRHLLEDRIEKEILEKLEKLRRSK
ncbi:NYN domain-containing protein [Clostridium swellfunianum]|uniref:NYN domain-containing protein n=1 Tax=Clostridium swellfunianum TaxID=1367462 RepID=UPI00203041E1|nr:NYN domain-containing protein [Clostridium swellfunianum]MCM0650359.1 NYN domain-containing protein [Clostridium swellfunianum]